MKRLFTIAALSVMTLGLVSCKAGQSYYNSAISDLKSRMKDPTSLIVNNATGYYVKKDGSESWACRINYNGKNSYGAYAGSSNVYYYLSGGAVKYSGTDSVMYTLISMQDGAQLVTYA